MKKIILISATIFAYCILVTANCFSQGTAINKTGATAKNSALLDISCDSTSNMQGILIPRVRLNSVTDTANFVHPVAKAKSLLVFNTGYGGLTPEGFYYWNGAQWSQVLTSGSGSGNHYVGELYGGGVVFWVDETGNHGLICGMVDLSTGIVWTKTAYQSITVPAPGALSDWNGQSNTNAIVSQAGADITYAAGLCDAYTNTDYGTGVYSDWYLPARSELFELWSNLKSVNKALESDGDASTIAITRDNYWTSSEYYNWNAYIISFSSGFVGGSDKVGSCYVRAIRAF